MAKRPALPQLKRSQPIPARKNPAQYPKKHGSANSGHRADMLAHAMNKMKLLTTEILKALPPLGSQEDVADPIAYVKFFSPDAGWTWYATEGEPEGDDFLFFGYVIGHESEWGHFSMSELESFLGALGLPVERDRFFTPRPASTLTRK